MISTILVYVLLWAFLGNDQEKIDQSDASKFRTIALISLGVGAICTLIFHLLVRGNTRSNSHDDISNTNGLLSNHTENSSIDILSINGNGHINEEMGTKYLAREQPNYIITDVQQTEDDNTSTLGSMNIKDWLCEPQTYQVACVYMSARLFVNVTQTYIPLFIQETLELKALNVALIPIIMYISGFFVSIAIKPITMRIGNKLMFVIACMIGLSSCLLMNPGEK